MSVVTNLILCTQHRDGMHTGNQLHVELLNAYLREEFEEDRFVQVNYLTRSRKTMEGDVFICAVNGLDSEGFIALWRRIPWEFPDCVQLMVKGHGEEKFTVYELED